ncbi:hypothetical protein TRFO_31895 [Tritrichomonas foetus]|uniref:Uncharacterized protein n=1 Tax=Tritrichomonas foetus TaxID=1144522 RepID=A0A1J4JRD0_9EUKA|nr:hypothetical protein TRFO_31895 [Tritrichomonas foetus]|eukprot:OHT01306.1 hypothetical protein TRFO_31895 [Tritrichomonas foetus]
MTHVDEFRLQMNRTMAEHSRYKAEREEHLRKRQKVRQSNQISNKISELKSEKVRYYRSFQSYNCFGSDTPHWTIPSSRKAPPPPDPTPAPGKYNLPFVGIETKNKGFTFKKATDLPEDRNLCEVMRTHEFPNPKETTIAKKSKTDHFYLPVPVSPSPKYLPPSLGGPKPVSIGHKYQEVEIPCSPGPAKYTPKDILTKKSLAAAVPRSTRKCFIEDSKNDNPGPGSYDVTPPIPRAPKWTNRARERSKKFQKLYAEHDRPWAVKKRAESTLIRTFNKDLSQTE